MENRISRREWLKVTGCAGLSAMAPSLLFSGLLTKETQMLRRRILSSADEWLPVVGLGTWIQFDVGPAGSEREPLTEVLRLMSEKGGKVIDSSPMYGRSEEVIGDLSSESGQADKFFYATKVWTSGEQEGINQMQSSLRKMRRRTMDLMQVHNLVDWQTHLKTIRKWKGEGKIRYSGVTHYTTGALTQLEKIVRSEKIDFVQLSYSMAVRDAESRMLPAALDNGVSVIINEPFASGKLFGLVKGKPLPDWAAEYDIQSWGQFFLKYILSHPAVTCVIPGTSNPKHVVDNMVAGMGRLPDEKGRKRMVEWMGKMGA